MKIILSRSHANWVYLGGEEGAAPYDAWKSAGMQAMIDAKQSVLGSVRQGSMKESVGGEIMGVCTER